MHNPAATAVEQVKAVRAERLPRAYTSPRSFDLSITCDPRLNLFLIDRVVAQPCKARRFALFAYKQSSHASP
jgi:hypothetical protein